MDTKETKKVTKRKALSDNTPMTQKAFCEWMRKSKSRHIHIIADYAEQKMVHFETKAQWNAFIIRNTKAAQSLSPYTEKQIAFAFNKMRQNYIKIGTEHWTLETLSKYLDD